MLLYWNRFGSDPKARLKYSSKNEELISRDFPKKSAWRNLKHFHEHNLIARIASKISSLLDHSLVATLTLFHKHGYICTTQTDKKLLNHRRRRFPNVQTCARVKYMMSAFHVLFSIRDRRSAEGTDGGFAQKATFQVKVSLCADERTIHKWYSRRAEKDVLGRVRISIDRVCGRMDVQSTTWSLKPT